MTPSINRRLMLAALTATAWRAGAKADARISEAQMIIEGHAIGDRTVEIHSFKPSGPAKGAIMFFHGAFSAPAKYQRLIAPWVDAGYGVLAPLHVDSTDHPDHKAYDRPAVWRTRLEDMALVVDLAAKRSHGTLIAAGHSYGALLALALVGAKPVPPPGVDRPLADPRCRLALALSPPSAMPGLISPEGFGAIAAPILVQTGTRDVLPGFIDDYHGHLDALNHAKISPRYGLVLEGVDHYFGGGICRPELPGPVQEAGLAEAIAVSLDVIAAELEGSAPARARLEGRLGAGTGLTRL